MPSAVTGRNSQQLLHLLYDAGRPEVWQILDLVDSMAKQSHRSKLFVSLNSHRLCASSALWLAPLVVTRWPWHLESLAHKAVFRVTEENSPLVSMSVSECQKLSHKPQQIPPSSCHSCLNQVPYPPRRHPPRMGSLCWRQDESYPWHWEYDHPALISGGDKCEPLPANKKEGKGCMGCSHQGQLVSRHRK